MNKKQIVQLVIVIIAFSASGLVLYNGFFKSDNNAALQAVVGSGATSDVTEDVLPNGDKLDFNVLKKQNLFYNQISYPKLEPAGDYGVPVENLIVAPPTN